MIFFLEVDHQPRGTSRHQQNFGFPAHIFVEVTYFFREKTHRNCVSNITSIAKTVNGGRLFSFLNVKLVLYNSQSLHWFTFQKWGFSWSWRLTNIENETIKFEDEWSLIQRHNWQSNIFNEAIVLMVLLLSLSGETCHFLDFFPTLTKVFLFMTTLSMCFLH